MCHMTHMKLTIPFYGSSDLDKNIQWKNQLTSEITTQLEGLILNEATEWFSDD